MGRGSLVPVLSFLNPCCRDARHDAATFSNRNVMFFETGKVMILTIELQSSNTTVCPVGTIPPSSGPNLKETLGIGQQNHCSLA